MTQKEMLEGILALHKRLIFDPEYRLELLLKLLASHPMIALELAKPTIQHGDMASGSHYSLVYDALVPIDQTGCVSVVLPSKKAILVEPHDLDKLKTFCNKVEAIKWVRSHWHIGLIDAKTLVETPSLGLRLNPASF